MIKILSTSVLLLGSLLACGCGSREQTGKLSGKIRFDNLPVYEGILIVVSEDGRRPVNARLHGDGTYSLDKAPAGTVRIAFQTFHARDSEAVKPDPNAKKLPAEITSKMNKMKKDGTDSLDRPGLTEDQKKSALALRNLPERYSSWEKSGLTTTVEPNADNNYDIIMTK